MVYCSGTQLAPLAKGPSINDVSSEGEGGGTPQKPMKGDENRYLVLGIKSRRSLGPPQKSSKADVPYFKQR